MKNQRLEFNGGRSAIVLAFLPVNQAWTVYREDRTIHGCQRIYPTHAAALADYEARVDFVKQMEATA